MAGIGDVDVAAGVHRHAGGPGESVGRRALNPAEVRGLRDGGAADETCEDQHRHGQARSSQATDLVMEQVGGM